MPRPTPSVMYWEKALQLTINIYTSIRAERERTGGKKKYRGLEYRWYTVWIAMLSSVCNDTETVTIAAQPRFSLSISDNDDNEKNTSRIPDLALIRVIGNKRVIRNSRVVRSIPYESYVLLMEIKNLSEKQSRYSRGNALEDARRDLLHQVQVFFSAEKGDDSEKAVIGVSAAGDYWAWEVLTPKDFLDKPPPQHHDGTYEPTASNKAVKSEIERKVPKYYKLFTSDSDDALQDMLKAIKTLPCSKHFCDNL